MNRSDKARAWRIGLGQRWAERPTDAHKLGNANRKERQATGITARQQRIRKRNAQGHTLSVVGRRVQRLLHKAFKFDGQPLARKEWRWLAAHTPCNTQKTTSR